MRPQFFFKHRASLCKGIPMNGSSTPLRHRLRLGVPCLRWLLPLTSLLATATAQAAQTNQIIPKNVTIATVGADRPDGCHNNETVRCCYIVGNYSFCETFEGDECPTLFGQNPVPGSIIDVANMQFIHTATDWSVDEGGGGGCSPCGGSRSNGGTRLDGLRIRRIYRQGLSESQIATSLGPNTFLDHDVHFEFLNDTQARLSQPDATRHFFWNERASFQGDNADDGVLWNSSINAAGALRYFSDAAATQPTVGRANLRVAVLRNHDGSRGFFEKCAFNGTFFGRLIRYEDANGNATVITYQHAASEPVADQTRYKIVTKITDPYGREAVFTYSDSILVGRQVVTQIALPGNQIVRYQYNSDRLVGVTYPNGDQSTITHIFGDADGVAAQCFKVQIDEAGTTGMHRRKTAFLANATWVDPVTQVSHMGWAGRIRILLNGNDEVSYAGFDTSAANTTFYSQGRMHSYDVQGSGSAIGTPKQEAIATSWDLAQPISTWVFETQQTFGNGGLPLKPSRRTDSLGRIDTYTWDATQMRLNKIAYHDGTTCTKTYNTFRQPLTEVDRLGRRTEWTYDGNGNLLTHTVAQGTPEEAVRSYTYQATGKRLLESSTDFNGNRTDFTYDARGFLDRVIEPKDFPADAVRPVTDHDYDAAGRLVAVTDPEGRRTVFGYDDRNRLITTTYPDGSFEEQIWGSGDDVNLVVQRRDRTGAIEACTYDRSGREIQCIQAFGTPDAISRSTVWLAGTTLPLSRTDAGEATSFTYDFIARVIATARKANNTKTLTDRSTYDPHRRLLSSQDAYGRKSFPVYDINDHVIRQVMETVPDAINTTLALNGAVPSQQQLADLARPTVANAAFIITDQVVDAEGQTRKTVDGRGIVSTQDYDAQGRTTVSIAARATVPATTTNAVIRAGTAETAITDPRIARTSEMIFDDQGNVIEERTPRFFDSTDVEGFQQARSRMTYTGRNLLATRIDAPDTVHAATESYTYFLDGRAKTRTDGRGQIWRTVWGVCCARIQAQLDPAVILPGATVATTPGSITRHNDRGDLTHQAVVSSFDPSVFPTLADPTNATNIPDAATIAETTTRYDSRQRPIARTVWLIKLGEVDANNPPIADRATGPVPGATDPASAGLTTTWVYDDNTNDALGLSGTFAADKSLWNPGLGADGSAVAVTNPDGETSVSFQDALGRTVFTADALNDRTQTKYDILVTGSTGAPTGNLVETQRIIDPSRSGYTGLALVDKSRSDGARRTLAMIDPLGKLSRASYDANGNRVLSRDPNNTGDDCHYDEADRSTVCTDTIGHSTFTAYDANGNAVQTVDGLGAAALGGPNAYDPPFSQGATGVSTCVFDARDRKKSCTDRIQALTVYTYDQNSNLRTLTDDEGGLTSYFYDPRNLLEREEFPTHVAGTNPGQAGNDARTYAYDGARRLVERRDQDGVLTAYTFDAASRLEKRAYPDAVNDIFTYDPASRLLSADSPRYGVLVGRTYRDDGTLATETQRVDGVTRTVTHTTQDKAKRPTGMTYPTGAVLSRTFTKQHDLDVVKVDGVQVVDLTYDSGRRETSRKHGNNITTSSVYRADNLRSKVSAAGIIDYRYTYDANKRKLTETDAIASMAGFSQTFGYDAEGRLTSWSRPGAGIPAIPQVQNWTLDPVGDWAQTVRDGVTETRQHNAVHEILNSQLTGEAAAKALEHDAKGNLLTDPRGGPTGLGQRYGWDFENRLAVAGRWTPQDIGLPGAVGSTTTVNTNWTVKGAGSAIGGSSDKFHYVSLPITGDAVITARVHSLAGSNGSRRAGVMLRASTAANAQHVFACVLPTGQAQLLHRALTGGGTTTVSGATATLPNRWLQVRRLGNALSAFASAASANGPWVQIGTTQTIALGATPLVGLAVTSNANTSLATAVFSELSITSPNPVPYVTYGYDALGRRAWKQVDGVKTVFVSAGARELSEFANGTHLQSYVHGSYIDDVMAMIRQDGARFFLHHNHLFSVGALTNAAGAVVERYAYSAYGDRETVLEDVTVAQQVGTTGRYHDTETRLINFRARSISDMLGRFFSRNQYGFGAYPRFTAGIEVVANIKKPLTAVANRMYDVRIALDKYNKRFSAIINNERIEIMHSALSADRETTRTLSLVPSIGYIDGMSQYMRKPNFTDPSGEPDITKIVEIVQNLLERLPDDDVDEKINECKDEFKKFQANPTQEQGEAACLACAAAMNAAGLGGPAVTKFLTDCFKECEKLP